MRRLSFLYILIMFFFSCVDMRVENGFVVSPETTRTNNGIFYTQNTNIAYGYAEIDFKIEAFQSELFQIFMRGQPGGVNNQYLCQFADPNNTGDIGVVSGAFVNGNYSFDELCSNPGGQIEVSLNFTTTDGFKNINTLGCEIVKVGGIDYLRTYVNRQMITEYVIGSGTLQNDCATANVDPGLPAGRVGFGWNDQTHAKAASKNMKVKEFRLYSQRPF